MALDDVAHFELGRRAPPVAVPAHTHIERPPALGGGVRRAARYAANSAGATVA
jgi:hypothetical protein